LEKADIGVTRDSLERYQIAVYFASVGLAALAGLLSPSFAGIATAAIKPMIAILMYAMFLQIPFLELRQAFGNWRFMGPC